MRKFTILTLLVFAFTTNLINEVKAQKPGFLIPVEEEKIAKIGMQNYQTQPETQKEVVVPEITPEPLPVISPVTLSNADKEKLIASGYKADYLETYKQAALKFGLEWQVLAAVHKIESGQSGDTSRQSNCGATGPMQFMPGTFRGYSTDGDGDGIAKITDVEDAIFTAAKYLSANKGATDIGSALFRYNHSQSYVNKVQSMIASLK